MIAPRVISAMSAPARRISVAALSAPASSQVRLVRFNTTVPPNAPHAASAPSTPPNKNTHPAVWAGVAVVGAGAIYYYFQARNSSALGTYQAIKEGDFAKAGSRAFDGITGQYPGLRQTLNYLVGKDIGESVTSTLESLQHAQQTATSSDAGKKLRARAKEVETSIRDLLKEALANKDSAIKELGPAAKKHYDAVVSSVKDSNEGVWGKLETTLQAFKSEGAKFANEAKHSDVGEKLKAKLQELLKKADDIKKEGEKLSSEIKK